MNEPDTSTPPPFPSKPAPAPADPKTEPLPEMTGQATLGNTLDHLLKRPGALLHALHTGSPGRPAAWLGLASVLCLAAFGLVLGFFSGGDQYWAAPLKLVLGVAASALLTWPSLCIFGFLSGMDIPLRTITGLLVAMLALFSLLLLGLAPVAWIFSSSTESLPFMGFLTIVFWGIALCFGLGLLFRGARLLGVRSPLHLALWAAIFVVVTLQMSSTLRPILGSADTFFPTEKKFFLNHWGEQLARENDAASTRGWR